MTTAAEIRAATKLDCDGELFLVAEADGDVVASVMSDVLYYTRKLA